MKRREFVTLLGGAAVWPATGWGQEAKLPKIPRIGSLMFGSPAASAGRVEVLGAAAPTPLRVTGTSHSPLSAG
jgi:hypothetical protein